RGTKPAVFVDTFENSGVEKPAVLAAREIFPGTLTVGFQHWLAPAPLVLQHFAGARESASAGSMPDIIACNLSLTKKVYAEEGFPPERLRVGPSLRYLSLLEPAAARSEPNTVFVGLSVEPGAAAELLAKLLDAFPAADGPRFRIKPHPMMSHKTLAELLADR